MFFDEGARKKEAELVRSACENLGVDEEMTALVLASHRHDPQALDVIVTNGGDLFGYVRSKLALWEAIFAGDRD